MVTTTTSLLTDSQSLLYSRSDNTDNVLSCAAIGGIVLAIACLVAIVFGVYYLYTGRCLASSRVLEFMKAFTKGPFACIDCMRNLRPNPRPPHMRFPHESPSLTVLTPAYPPQVWQPPSRTSSYLSRVSTLPAYESQESFHGATMV